MRRSPSSTPAGSRRAAATTGGGRRRSATRRRRAGASTRSRAGSTRASASSTRSRRSSSAGTRARASRSSAQEPTRLHYACFPRISLLSCLKKSRRENTIRPKLSRNDVDATELERFEAFAGRGVPLVGSGAGAHALPHHHALPALLRAVQQRPLLAHRVPEPRHGHVLPRGLFDYLPDGHRRPGRRRREPLRHREDRRPAASFERPGKRRAIVPDALGRPRPTSRASRPSTCWRACPSRTSSCSSSTTRTGPRAARARSRGF